MHQLPGLTLLTLAGIFGSSPAFGDNVEYGADGSVRVGNEVFATTLEYYRSETFRKSGARCGTVDPLPGIAAGLTDCSEVNTLINAGYNDGRTFIIPVVFHVIKNTAGEGAISDALIKSQIDILNEDFLALPGTPGGPGANTNIKFVLARFDPSGMPTTGINVITNNAFFIADSALGGEQMKTALRWDPSRYLNVYTSQADNLLGYATFPFDTAGQPSDGVVLLWKSVGRNSGNAPYDKGRTATHEVGHYLGLYHTFQHRNTETCATGGPYVSGDLIADTNRHAEPVYDCVARTSCTPALPVPIENYMNYTPDACMTKFTPEQSNRMRCSIINYRKAFVNTEPKSQFTVAATGLDLALTNTSTDAETAQNLLASNWDFGDGTTSTEPSPIHTYAVEGTYTVTLEVIDPGSGVSKSTQMVVVAPEVETTGGCCQAPNGDTTFVLCAAPVLIVLRRRRRRV